MSLRAQAKSRDRATAEGLHDESSKVVDLQSRLKLSREQVFALEVSVYIHSSARECACVSAAQAAHTLVVTATTALVALLPGGRTTCHTHKHTRRVMIRAIVQAAVRENGERADALQAQLDSERSGKSESLKTAESHRQSLALENQRLAFDMESLKQKEVCVRQCVRAFMCMCVCACARARARARACVCVCTRN